MSADVIVQSITVYFLAVNKELTCLDSGHRHFYLMVTSFPIYMVRPSARNRDMTVSGRLKVSRSHDTPP